MLFGLFFLAMSLNTDSPPPAPSEPPALNITHAQEAQQPDAQQIASLLAQQYAAWDAKDIEGYMQVFWRSPLLVYVTEGAIWTGWDQVKANVERQYPDKNNMGHPVLERLQTNVVSPETATTIEWWTVYFPAAKVRGFTTSTWRKFSEGWRMIETHTSTLELP